MSLAVLPAIMLLTLSFLGGAIELILSRCVRECQQNEIVKMVNKEENIATEKEFIACIQFWQTTNQGVVLYGFHLRFGLFLTLSGLLLTNAFSVLMKHIS